MTLSRFVFCAVVAFACVTGLSDPARAQARPVSCGVAGQNLFVRDTMSDIYYWYREIPDLDPVSFDSPQAYLEAVRYRPLDASFSYITDRASNDAFFSASQFIGLGLSTAVEGLTMRVTEVYPESPALEANLSRGDRIVEIDGRRVSALIESGEIGGAFGPSDVGYTVEMLVERAGQQFRTSGSKRLVTIPTVSRTQVFQVGSRTVGYVYFRNFVEPSYEALDIAFAELRERGVNELVLDLRYNGGGLVGVAQFLASLIGGARTDGQLFAEYFHNDKRVALNRTLRFVPQLNALGLDRLVVITTRSSASASELIINSLRPFISVVVIGARTYGKPVGQYGINFCDKVLAPVAFTLKNADGEGDFFGGFAPTCPAADDLEHQLGDPSEVSLNEALHFVDSGRCSAPSTSGPASVRDDTTRLGRSPWNIVVGAH
jgi:C-terminal processing protease CtpA/Prc